MKKNELNQPTVPFISNDYDSLVLDDHQDDIWNSKEIKTNNLSYLERQKCYESNARSYPRRIPIAIKKAKGIHVTDVDGNVYVDCLSGAGSLALGHNHPLIHAAIQQCIDNHLPLLTLDLTTPVKDEFVEALFSILPKDFRKNTKVQFCSPSGADAVEAAIKLAKTATGRSSVFSFSGSYHGMTNGALSLTANTKVKNPELNLMKDVFFLPYPYSYRCPFGIGGEEAERVSLHYIENLLKDSHSGVNVPAAFILEAVQGEGGTIPASPFWLQGIRRITSKYNIPLIIDEIQAGIGRTGDMFAFEESGITPDIVVMSKAIGGSLPLSLVVYKEYLDVWKSGAHAGTFRGNQMAMATGTVVLNYMKEHNILENVNHVGKYIKEELNKLKEEFPCIGEVRGRGLIIGVEIVDTSVAPNHINSYPVNPELSSKIQQECLKNGLIIETGGRESCVLRMLPPLNIEIYQATEIIEILKKSIKSAIQK